MPDMQTSFIPNKQDTRSVRGVQRPSLGNVFIVFSVIVFFASLGIYGGLFFYKNLLEQNINSLSDDIGAAEDVIRPSLVQNLRDFDARIASAERILDQHTAVSPIFALLEETTIENVRFTELTYEHADANRITLAGEANSYETLAYQSQVFSEHSLIEDPQFAEFGLTPTGNIEFEARFLIAPQLIDFQSAVSGGSSGASTQQSETTANAETENDIEDSPEDDTATTSGDGITGEDNTQ